MRVVLLVYCAVVGIALGGCRAEVGVIVPLRISNVLKTMSTTKAAELPISIMVSLWDSDRCEGIADSVLVTMKKNGYPPRNITCKKLPKSPYPTLIVETVAKIVRGEKKSMSSTKHLFVLKSFYSKNRVTIGKRKRGAILLFLKLSKDVEKIILEVLRKNSAMDTQPEISVVFFILNDTLRTQIYAGDGMFIDGNPADDFSSHEILLGKELKVVLSDVRSAWLRQKGAARTGMLIVMKGQLPFESSRP